MIKPIEWIDSKVKILDQTKLPQHIEYIETEDYRDIIKAIKQLKVRGAPAIGIAAGYGIALGALHIESNELENYLDDLNRIIDEFALCRPTAVNIFRTIDRMKKWTSARDIDNIKSGLLREALKIHQEEITATSKICEIGSKLIKDGFTILTHCNTGPLATGGYGTALGIIILASKQHKNIRAIATETRPLLQGARLTTWELACENVPVTLIVDSAAGYFLRNGKVNCVIVGADRIALNGDTANKIGTYSLAVLAKENNVPFYIAAPTSTIDFSINSGDQIPIEERSPEEIIMLADKHIITNMVAVSNPAFDITPARYITAIITEKGIVDFPFYELSKFAKECINDKS